MSDQYTFVEPPEIRPSGTEIHHIFSHHSNTLYKQKWKIADDITEWSNTLIHQIQEHVAQQRKLLDEIYEQKTHYLDTIRDRFLKQALIYEEKDDTEQLNQLINQCNNLKIELATLGCFERPIVSVQLVTEEQRSQQNPDEHKDHQIKTEQSENHATEITNNTDINESLLPKLTSPNTEPIYSSSFVIKSTNDENQSINSNSKLSNNISDGGGLSERCPICFMIFPYSMTARDRNFHVNEHYKDD